MKILDPVFVTFDDVLLMPQYSIVESRNDVSLQTHFGDIELDIPVLSANMDTITNGNMALAMARGGGGGVLHRYALIEQQEAWLDMQESEAIASIGVSEQDYANAERLRRRTDHICLDIAHVDSIKGLRMVQHLVGLGFRTVMAGNVGTGEAALRLAEAGANVVKVGIGPGSVCSTRGVTGHGVPQLSAIMDVSRALEGSFVNIVADGGMKNSGDIVKALAAGAHAVMTGSLFAGCSDAALPSKYRGMASSEAQLEFKGEAHGMEGVSTSPTPKPSAFEILRDISAGIRSGLSYSGARNLAELREKAVFIRVSSNTILENSTRNV